MSWLSRNAKAVEAAAASVTALTAVAAVAGVIFQLRAADEISRGQSAREGFATHLTLSVAHPEYAQPDVCALVQSAKSVSYMAYVAHLMFAAEQMLEVGEGWETTFHEALKPHARLICHIDGIDGDTEQTQALISSFRDKECALIPPCADPF